MTFWIIATLMVVGTVAALAVPLLRQSAGSANEAEYDLEVYRDQLAELERDLGRGVITAEEMEAARTEIARRMLAADARLRKGGKAKAAAGNTAMRVLAALLAVTLPAGAVLLYLQVGNPGAPDMPLAQRTDLPVPGGDDQRIRQQLAGLEKAAEANPGDADAWLRLADAYKSFERFGDAAAAYRKALGLGPVSTAVNGDFAEVLVMAAQGSVTPEARAVFEGVLAVAPVDPRAQYYLALGDYQAGKTREALDRWAALIESSPADAPWLGIVRENLAQAAQDLGLDVAEVMPEPQPARDAGVAQLTPEQRAELEAMTPAEREAMVRDMVDGLDARLREDPMDLDGWERLIRARMVLGERDAAQDALERALEAFAEAPFPSQRLAELGGELQLDVPEGAADAPDIGAMVERLAARLEDEPDDLEGWMMLARSYTVLGEAEKAREAMENAARLAPDNPNVLTLQARAIRDANSGADNEESIVILRRVLELEPDNGEALWFLGNAEALTGNRDKARELLQRLLAQIPEGDPDRDFIQQRIDELGG